MKFSSRNNRILSRPDTPTSEHLPLIAQIAFDELETPAATSFEIKPISCGNCEAVLMDVGLVKQDPALGLIFQCAYCGTVNKLGALPEGYQGGTDVEYVIEKAKPVEVSTTAKSVSGDVVSAIIDVSGSMGGGKIAAVKHNLVQTLKDMKATAAESAFMLITFESAVELFTTPGERAISISDDRHLHDKEELEKFVAKKIKNMDIGRVGKTADQWIRMVERLTSRDKTALGPALVAGIQCFIARGTSGRILLLTDGLANVGFGRLEGSSNNASRKMYEELAKKCLDNNIVVDVIGVGGGNELALDVLGNLSELTGGELYFVTQEELNTTFGELSSRNFIGRDVRVRVFTPDGIEIDEVSGISGAMARVNRFEEIKAGSVTADREALIKFNVRKKIEREAPVQVQVEFKDRAGNKKLRVFQSTLVPSEDEEEYKKNYDPKPLSVLNIQKAGEHYKGGRAREAREMLLETQAYFQMNQEAFSAQDAGESMDFLADELERLEDYEEIKKAKASASYSAAIGQKRARMSIKQKMAEVEARKRQQEEED